MSDKKRNPFLVRGALTLLAAGLLATAPGLASAADRINVGALRLTSHSPSYIAYEKGYFADEGLEVSLVYFQAAQPMAVAIASGDVDFGITAISGGLINLSEKGAIKVIGGALQEHEGVDGQKILASAKAHDDGMKTPADIKGHRFGVTTAGSSFHYMAHKIADKEGFARSDIEIVPLQSVGNVIAALKSGQIDAWSIVPNIAGAVARGPEATIIGDVADYIPGYQVTTVFTSTKNTTERADLVRRFLKAFSRGIDDYNAALVDKTMSEDETKAIVELIHKHVYTDRPIDKADPAIRAGAMRINPNARLSVSSVRDQLEWFKSEKMVPAEASLENLVDTSFVETD